MYILGCWVKMEQHPLRGEVDLITLTLRSIGLSSYPKLVAYFSIDYGFISCDQRGKRSQKLLL